jgi:hypothetical protein
LRVFESKLALLATPRLIDCTAPPAEAERSLLQTPMGVRRTLTPLFQKATRLRALHGRRPAIIHEANHCVLQGGHERLGGAR